MAQWSHKDRTLYAKVVYYGPAFGGKTTNLESLHRITDPKGAQDLLSVQTSDDRTLFFDLLPFDLGDILGYQVALKLYTVPGQVRYETTRQVVLSGADAVIFVADSNAGREEQNRWSLQNLRMNMRAKRIDPARVPVIFQFNKQDLPEAGSPDAVARWLGVSASEGYPAIATRGEGVLETFIAASRVMLERLVAHADERTRREIDVAQLGNQVDLAFAPFRTESVEALEPSPAPNPVVLGDKEPLQDSVRASMELGERLSDATALATRLEDEAETYRRLSELLRNVGANFDRNTIIDSTLGMVADLLDVRTVSLIGQSPDGDPVQERAWGTVDDPLLLFPEGRELLLRMLNSKRPCVVDDLRAECGAETGAVAAVPVESDLPLVLLAHAARPEQRFDRQDVRFLDTVAGHLAVGLEKSELHGRLSGHRDELKGAVVCRTEELRQAYEDLRALEQTKDRFLDNLSHEMKTPLTAILTSAVFLRDYNSSSKERAELLRSIIDSGEALQGHLDHLFRLVNLESEPLPSNLEETTPGRLAKEAIRLCGHSTVQVKLEGAPRKLLLDTPRVTRALSNLLDNATKFSPAGSPVELHICRGPCDTVDMKVLDHGPGIPEEERERLLAPFEQGGDPLTSKPSGIGMGLYESETIVRRLGGTLIYRARKGGGSEFQIRMPVQPKVPEEAQEMVGV